MEYGAIVASGITGMVGTAVGAIMNHFLSRSSRAAERIDEAQKAEYRELLGQFHQSYMTMMELGQFMTALGPDEQRELRRAEIDSVRTIADRLYIADDLAQMNIMTRWTNALNAFKKTRDIVAFSDSLGDISEAIRKKALAKTD